MASWIKRFSENRDEVARCEEAGAKDEAGQHGQGELPRPEQAQIKQRIGRPQFPEDEDDQCRQAARKPEADGERTPAQSGTVGEPTEEAEQNKQNENQADPIEARQSIGSDCLSNGRSWQQR